MFFFSCANNLFNSIFIENIVQLLLISVFFKHQVVLRRIKMMIMLDDGTELILSCNIHRD
jgi:hypothetical protein